DFIAGLLEPFGQCSFDNAFAHLGHYDVGHAVSISLSARNGASALRANSMAGMACISKSKICPKWCASVRFTSSASAWAPRASVEVTGFASPQGTMYWKYRRSVVTFRAQPW